MRATLARFPTRLYLKTVKHLAHFQPINPCKNAHVQCALSPACVVYNRPSERRGLFCGGVGNPTAQASGESYTLLRSKIRG